MELNKTEEFMDISAAAVNVGIKYQTKISKSVWNEWIATGQINIATYCKETAERLRTLLLFLLYEFDKSANISMIMFNADIYKNGKINHVELKAVCRPDSSLKPVITIMFPLED
jgi:hypothetical protein